MNFIMHIIYTRVNTIYGCFFKLTADPPCLIIAAEKRALIRCL